MDSLLADLGNHGLKFASRGVESVCTFSWRDPSQHDSIRVWLRQKNPSAIHLASSSAAGWELLSAEVFSEFSVHLVQDNEIPIVVKSEGTGLDRILAAWMALQLTPGPLILADCGTAYTLDVVDAMGQFRGGAIGAGLGLQEQALISACPHLDRAHTILQEGIPLDTAAAVAAGTRRAFAHGLCGLATEFQGSEKDAWSFFLSGGDAARLAPLLPNWQVEEHLVLRGLSLLFADH